MRKGAEEEKERRGRREVLKERNMRDGKEMMVKTELKVEEEREGRDVGEERIMAVGI